MLEFLRSRRPGHIGHTPQPVSELIRSARAAAFLTDTKVDGAATDRRLYAAQVFPRLQSPEAQSSVFTTLQIETARARLGNAGPLPNKSTFAPNLGVDV